MRDPNPENIQGMKRHSIEWQVDVGVVLVVLAVIYAIHVASDVLEGKDEDSSL